MSTIPVIAILDIGKTNKKIFLFDERYHIVYEESQRFDETVDEDNFPCEDIQLLNVWIKHVLQRLTALEDFSIQAINFSAYGASLVHTDEAGDIIFPLYNYLKPYPALLKKQFFEKYGGEKQLSKVTASPVLDSLNSGMQLYRLKYEKRLLDKPGFSLHLPQYISYLVSGKMFSDMTSIGCHTMLWNFETQDYHTWVYEESVHERLAPIVAGNEVVIVSFNNKVVNVGVGLHDSSAALIPYLSAFHQPFILISTGTWCISLNPFNNEPLTEYELEQDCLSFISYTGKPVKASRIFAGNEHEKCINILSAYFNKPANYYEQVTFQRGIMEWLEINIEQPLFDDKIGPFKFTKRDLSAFQNYETAYHQLLLDIMRQQQISTSLLLTGEPVKRIFVDGGFAKNAVYMNLLALAFPDIEIFAASVSQATAMGAALAIHDAWNKHGIRADMIDLKYYSSGS